MSRAMTLSLGGTAVVCCIHGAVKNEVKEILYDERTQEATQCACCGNCFRFLKSAEPQATCPTCTPRRNRG